MFYYSIFKNKVKEKVNFIEMTGEVRRLFIFPSSLRVLPKMFLHVESASRRLKSFPNHKILVILVSSTGQRIQDEIKSICASTKKKQEVETVPINYLFERKRLPSKTKRSNIIHSQGGIRL